MKLGTRVDTRIKKNLKKHQNRLLRLQELDAKEPQTEKEAMDMLCDIFGYDLEDIHGQYGNNNGRSCDAVIKNDKKIFYVFECKRISTPKEKFSKHLRQVVEYCATLNVPWAILTNGIYWQLLYVDVKAKPVTAMLVWEFDVLEISHRQIAHRELLLPLCCEAISKKFKEKILDEKLTLSTENIVRAILSDEVLKKIITVLRRKTGVLLETKSAENEIRKLVPRLAENIRGFRTSSKKTKTKKADVKVVAVKKENEIDNFIGKKEEEK